MVIINQMIENMYSYKNIYQSLIKSVSKNVGVAVSPTTELNNCEWSKGHVLSTIGKMLIIKYFPYYILVN